MIKNIIDLNKRKKNLTNLSSATTLSITTFSIMRLNITTLRIMTFSIRINKSRHSAQ